MKKLFCLILSVIMMLEISCVGVFPLELDGWLDDIFGTVTDDGFGYYIHEDDGYAEIYGYCGDSKNIVFPSEIEGYPVTMLNNGGMMFMWYSGAPVESITIPSTVTYIDVECFSLSGLSAIESVVVDSDNSVYDSRDNCNAIIETETNTLLAGCSTTVIPEGVVSIHNSAFSFCENLESIEIPSTVTNISHDAFLGCDNLVELIVDDNNTIYDSRNNSNAIIETASDTLKIGCTGTVIPDTVVTIGKNAFFNSCIKSIEIPYSVNNIEDCAFLGCDNLTKIVLPSSLESIGNSVFTGCVNMTEITFLSKDCVIPDNEYALPDAYYVEVDFVSVTYYGYEGSTIQKHCEKYNLMFEPLKTSDDDNKEDPVNPDRVFGDTDGDGDVSVLDATAIQLHLASLKIMDSTAFSVADTDKDGDVSILDATQIQLFLAKLIPDLQ